MKKITRIKIAGFLLLFIQALALALLFFVFKKDILIELIFFLCTAVLILILLLRFERILEENNAMIGSSLTGSVNDAVRVSKVGILVYNENYEITWQSDLFRERNLNKVSEKLLTWLPELQDLLQGNVSRTEIVINEEKYRVYKKEDAYVLFFRDISGEYDLRKKNAEEAYVIGLLNFDNYDELSVDEDALAYINTNIKVPVIEYFKQHLVVFKTLRNNRLYLILNEKIFSELLNDRFSILNTVRKEAKRADLDVTVSMAFGRGSADLTELDELASSLLEVVESRGGDQVGVRKIGGEAVFYGGSSEAREKQSRVKVRVIANSIKDLINRSSNVLIIGHKEADADCIGSAIALSAITRALGKEAYILIQPEEMEKMISTVVEEYREDLYANHRFISEDEAYEYLDPDSLVVMIDHHHPDQSNSSAILKQAEKIVIIDHHRRRADLSVEPLFVYIEAGASSTTELIVEFFPYITRRISLSGKEANIMYLGILIDTNNFKAKTGVRTFDVAKQLRLYGADPLVCNRLSQEPYEMVKKRSEIINAASIYRSGIMIATPSGIYSRSIASQAGDMMVQIKEVGASFVICNTSEDETIITARSDGSHNVQMIMEKMNGGGHMLAAGLQRKNTGVKEMKKELLKAIDEYLEENEDESNHVE